MQAYFYGTVSEYCISFYFGMNSYLFVFKTRDRLLTFILVTLVSSFKVTEQCPDILRVFYSTLQHLGALTEKLHKGEKRTSIIMQCDLAELDTFI